MENEDITQLLLAAGDGDPRAMDEVFASVYPRLRQIARSRRRSWHGDETLNTTAIIHEAYLKISDSPGQYRNRAHFFAVAARAMRQVLINYAEKKAAAKRGGGRSDVTLSDSDAIADEAVEDLLSLDEALRRLERMSGRQGQVVECLFFAGFSISETAEALDISPATVKRDWTTARAWLYRELQEDVGSPGAGEPS